MPGLVPYEPVWPQALAWQDVAVLQPPAAARSALPEQPQAIPAARERLARDEPEWQQVAKPDVRAQPRAGVPASQAVPAVPELRAGQDAPELRQVAAVVWGAQAQPPEVASASQGRLRVAPAAPELRAAQGVRELPRVAEAELDVPAQPPEAERDAQDHPEPDVAVASSAFRPVPFLPLAAPVRRPAEMFARAMLRRRIASPSEQLW